MQDPHEFRSDSIYIVKCTYYILIYPIYSIFAIFISKWSEIFIYLIMILGDSLGSPEFCIKIEKNLIRILEDPTFQIPFNMQRLKCTYGYLIDCCRAAFILILQIYTIHNLGGCVQNVDLLRKRLAFKKQLLFKTSLNIYQPTDINTRVINTSISLPKLDLHSFYYKYLFITLKGVCRMFYYLLKKIGFQVTRQSSYLKLSLKYFYLFLA